MAVLFLAMIYCNPNQEQTLTKLPVDKIGGIG
jgi:hypothetical protein